MTKITQLPVASTISDIGVFVIVDEGVTKQLSWGTLRNNGLKGDAGPQGPQGDRGLTGETGTVATIAVGTVSMTTASSATIFASTSTSSLNLTILDFVIPYGPKGDTGTFVSVIASSSTIGGVKIGSGIDILEDGTINVPAPTPYILPVASSSTVGGVKVGNNVNLNVDGTISVDFPPSYSLPVSSGSVLGGVKIGAGIGVATDGTISVTTGAFALQTATSVVLGGVKIGDGINISNSGTIAVNTASSSVFGGVKIGSGLDISSSGTISVNTGLSLASALTGDRLASNVVSSSLTSLGALKDLKVNGITTIGQTKEKFVSVVSTGSIVVNDCLSATIFVVSNVSFNFTADFINVNTTASEVVSFALLINQGATPGVPTSVQINSSPQVVTWQGGITPTGNANKKDLINFTVFLTTGTNIVLGSLASYG